MANFTNEKYNSMPEQVEENKNNIKLLYNMLKHYYHTELSLSDTTTSILISDTNAPIDTKSGLLIDANGLLFIINNGDGNALLIENLSNLQGPQGPQGPQGEIYTKFYPQNAQELLSVLNNIKDNDILNGFVILPNETIDISNDFATIHDFPLSNNVIVYGQPKTKIICNYTGNDYDCKTTYSVFEKVRGGGGFSLINVNIEASRIRYCVHDDDSDQIDIYENNYINCVMYLDNRNNDTWNHNCQCIGGGFGLHGIINIKGGQYTGKCVPTSELTRDKMYDISYHNSSVANAQSIINISNVYVAHTLRLSYYGASTLMTQANINNCSFQEEPQVTQENIAYNTINIEMIKYNNIYRDVVANSKKQIYDTLTYNEDGSITINKYTATYQITGNETLVNAHLTFQLISLHLAISEPNGFTDYIANVPKFNGADFADYVGIFAVMDELNNEDGGIGGTRITLPTNPGNEADKRTMVANANIIITYKSSTLIGSETIY